MAQVKVNLTFKKCNMKVAVTFDQIFEESLYDINSVKQLKTIFITPLACELL